MRSYAFVIDASEHAELSASSADRWLSCPGSVALSTGIPNHTTLYAAQGTAAHYIAAACQKDGGRADRWLGETALVEGHEISLDQELVDAVQEYLDDCADDSEPGDVVFIEQSFTAALRKVYPKLGGSGDRVRWRPRTRQLRVTDLKFGAGVAVDVDDNTQLKVYAVGALLTNSDFNAEEVELRIAQPRCDHEQGRFRSYKMQALDLLDFVGELISGARRTEEFGADLVPSKKACKFCPANAANVCPAVKKQSESLVLADFQPIDVAKYSKEQIAEFLEKAPLVEARISAIRSFAQAEMEKGEEFPGWKLVDKRAMRKWADEQAAWAALTDGDTGETLAGVMTEPELKSPAQVEKVLGKKKFDAMVGDLVEKKSSGHTIAPASDPRPQAHVALLQDFEAIKENE